MFLDPKTILEHVRIPHGAKVADFGTGTGHYAFAVAKRLQNGGVIYALDAFAPSVDALSREAARRGLALYTLESDLNRGIPFKDKLLTLGIVANLLHQLSDRKRFVDELKRVLAPGGEALVVDWAASFNNMGPTRESALAPSDAARLFQSAGFTIGTMLPAGTHHFAFVATAPASTA